MATEQKRNLRRVVAATLIVLVAIVVAAPTPSHAFRWGKGGKGGERARVERPQSAEDAVPVAEPQKQPSSRSARRRENPSSKAKPDLPEQSAAPATPPEKKPEPTPPPEEPKKPPVPKKTELEKRQEELQDAQKDYDRKKYKKSLEKSSKLIAEIRERDYLKGKDADRYKELLNDALALAQKSGERIDEPIIPSGTTGKALYFVF